MKKMNNKYILDAEGNPQVEPDLIKWAEWYETHDHHLADDRVGNARVSTVFLGLDHSFRFSFFEVSQRPVLWETMIFDAGQGELDLYQERYTSREAALAGHQKALEMVRNAASSEKEKAAKEAKEAKQ